MARQGLVGDPAHAERLESRCDLPNEWPTRLVFHMQHHYRRSMLHSVVTAAELASLQTPVLTIHGTQDRNAPYGGGREWAASLPRARLLTLEGVAHATHAEVDLLSILETFLSGTWPEGSERARSAADGQRSQLLAWDLLRQALAHHAPEGLTEGRALRIEWRGALRPRSQARTSEPPFEPTFPVTREATIGPQRRRLELVEEVRWPSFVSRFRSVVTPEDAFDVDLDTGAVSPPFREPEELFADVLIGLPPLVLSEILQDGPGSLRFEGVVEIDGQALHAVSALYRGERWDLLLEPEGALVSVGRMVDETMLGDTYETVRFAGATEHAGLRLPTRAERRLDGVGLVSELELVSASWTEVAPARFSRPSVEGSVEPDPATSSSTASAEALETLSPGVFLAPVPGRPDYQSLVVEREDHLVLVEAPIDEEATGALLTRVAERFPGKAIRWVVSTHHHFDHAGGVPTALASGAALVTTPGNVAFFRRAMTAPRTLAGGSQSDRSPEIHSVEDAWAIPGGSPEIEVLRVEPNEHAAEMIAVYLPESGLLFQGDLVRFPLAANELYRPQASSLVELIAAHGLAVDRISGVHGEVGDPASLREWVEAHEPGPSR